MTEKKKQLNPLLIDKRVMARNVAAGRLSQEEAESYLAQLPDNAGNFEDIAPLIYGDDTTKTAE